MERFNVSVLQEHQPGVSTHDVRSALENIKLPLKTIEAIVNIKSVAVIKKNVALSEAKKLQVTLHKCGLQTYLDLALSPDCFALGIRDIVKKVPVAPDIFILDENLVHPKIFGASQKKSITSNKINQKSQIEKIGHTWNPTLLIMATLIIALYLELYLVNILSAYLGLRSLASIAGIICLMLMTFSLHQLLQPLLYIEVFLKNSSHQLREEFSWQLTQKNYTLYDQPGAPTAFIHRQKNVAQLYDTNGNLLLQWDKSLKFKQLDDQKIEDIQYDFVMDNMSEMLDNYLSFFESILDIFKKKVNINEEKWRTEDGTAILDQDNKMVAVVFFQPCPALKVIKTDTDDKQTSILLCFTLAIMRSHYG